MVMKIRKADSVEENQHKSKKNKLQNAFENVRSLASWIVPWAFNCRKDEELGMGMFEMLPEEILDAVLCRMDLRDLLKIVPSVCRAWRHKLESPYFRELVLSGNRWLTVNAVDYNSEPWILLFDTWSSSRRWQPLKLDGFSADQYKYVPFVEGVLDGIFLINQGCYSIGNPLTKQWVKLRQGYWACLLRKPCGSGHQVLGFKVEDDYESLSAYLWDSTTRECEFLTSFGSQWGHVWWRWMASSFVADTTRRIYYSFYRRLFYSFDIDQKKWERCSLELPPWLEFRNEDERVPAMVMLGGEPMLVGMVDPTRQEVESLNTGELIYPPFRILSYKLSVGIFRLPDMTLHSVAPLELVRECIACVPGYLDESKHFTFSTDQRDNLWCVFLGSRLMIHYNMPADAWSLLPGPWPIYNLQHSAIPVNKANLFGSLSLSPL